MKNKFLLFIVFCILSSFHLSAQEKIVLNQNRDTILSAARYIMKSARYCALITMDSLGQAQARTMDAFLPDDNLVIWFGTNPKTRKVKEVRDNPKATLYFQAPDNSGYVTIKGLAYLENEKEAKQKYWKEEWNTFYKDRENDFILIKVIPKRLEIVSYKHKLTTESGAWEAPFMLFE